MPKAAVVHEFKAPLTLEERPVPTPDKGQVVVQMEASGVCHTDIHAAHGDWPVKPALPLVPGHEGVGRIVAVGPEAHGGVSEGDRVAIPWLGYACGECRFCNDGRETLCESQMNSGYALDGAYAEYAAAYARHVVKVPEGVEPLAAAPLTCAGVTTYKAVKVSGARPSMLAAIFGVGGLGHLAVQYAEIAGCEVIAVDIHDDKLSLAKELGATHAINALEQDPVAEIKKLGGADVAVATAVSPSAFEQAFGAMARGGTLVFVGLPAENVIHLPIFETVLNGITVRGSIVGTHHDLEEVFHLHELGRTRVAYETRRLEQVNDAFKEVEDGSAGTARLVFEF
jgi:propanol-preferring alcohol dehydrogenase